jgi:RNA recognition motif. (a.k.a. RRM, RBD, or RNP domain)
MRVFFGAIPPDLSEEQMIEVFKQYGPIKHLQIIKESVYNTSLQCGFMEFIVDEDAVTCCHGLHGLFYCGEMPIPIVVRPIEVEEIETKVFLSGLPEQLNTVESIAFHFGMQYGPILDVVLLRGQSAVVKFLYRSSADFLIEDANQNCVYNVNGDFLYSLKAQFAVEKENHADQAGFLTQKQRIVKPMQQLPPEINPAKLFVGCLPYSKTAAEVAEIFGQFGTLVEVAILTDPEGRSRGAAFVTYAFKENAEEAVSRLAGYVFPNSTRPINVSLALKQNSPQQWPQNPVVGVPTFPLLYYPVPAAAADLEH